MTADATSPQRASLREGTWGQFFAFLRRPVLPDAASGFSPGALVVVAKLLMLDVLAMVLFVGAISLAARLGAAPPKSLLAGMKLSPLLLSFIALGAPIGEELIFRSWQSGRPGHVGAFLIALVTGGLSAWMLIDVSSQARAIAGLALPVAGLALALWWLWSRRGRPAMGWFQRHYPWFFYGATVLFAAAHMTNFDGGLKFSMLWLVFPQFAIGLMLGHVRVRFGLWSGVLLHASHNSLFIALMLIGG